MIFHNTKLITLWETAVSFFFICIAGCCFPRREMQTTSRYASRTSASLGEGDSFIALRFGTYDGALSFTLPLVSAAAIFIFIFIFAIILIIRRIWI